MNHTTSCRRLAPAALDTVGVFPGNIYYTTTGGGGAHAFVTGSSAAYAPMPSPDGALVAYLSNESGPNELYVQRFPNGGERLSVSRGGASPARWSHDGRSLYFWDLRGKLIVASITSRPTLAVSALREINAEASPNAAGPGTTAYAFDVAGDGRIIVTEPISRSFELVLVRNGIPRATRGETRP